ncbi:hypothetical protein HaLaN_17304 [Haematococcus lacustris]|uniref:Secreted protein n=1 Tax=Haematococcus lacustris TaxID=44745 RepID=A0A699ZMP9_HAELA|nr:hypothetical protein HaLaN_17304 [Haematococcus lacustris]
MLLVHPRPSLLLVAPCCPCLLVRPSPCLVPTDPFTHHHLASSAPACHWLHPPPASCGPGCVITRRRALHLAAVIGGAQQLPILRWGAPEQPMRSSGYKTPLMHGSCFTTDVQHRQNWLRICVTHAPLPKAHSGAVDDYPQA